MENSPLTVERDSEDDDSSKKKKTRRAERLGAIVVEPKSGEDHPKETEDRHGREHFWRQLTRRSEEAGGENDDKASEIFLSDPETSVDGFNPEEFTEEDRIFAETELARARRQLISEEFAGITDSEHDNSTQAELMALEAFYDRILDDHESFGEAFGETMQDLGISPDQAEYATGEIEAADMDAPTAGDESRESGDPTVLPRSEHHRPAAEQTPVGNQEDQATPTASTPAASGGGSVPANFPPQTFAGGNLPRPPAPGSPAMAPAAPTAAEAAPAAAGGVESGPRYTRANVVGAAVVGGIIGYLVGRRRGRIKTEKKLLPVQKKLEKEVTALEGDMLKKELALRKAAHEQRYQQQVMDKLKRRADRERTPEPSGGADERTLRISKKTLNRLRSPALEANQLHGKKLPPERIGKVLMSAERTPSAVTKKIEVPAAEARHSETMSRRQLMEVSEKISVNNTNLRRIYESHLVGEQGLRRLVEAHLRGGNVNEVLQREMLEHQIDFERDPVMRDHQSAQDAADAGSAVSNLLSKTGQQGHHGDRDERAVLQAREEYHRAEAQRSQQHRNMADVAFAATIAILIAVIALLLINR